MSGCTDKTSHPASAAPAPLSAGAGIVLVSVAVMVVVVRHARSLTERAEQRL
jgi:hypothetical protein